MEPRRGPVTAALPPILDMDSEAARLRAAIEEDRATASDLENLYLLR